MTLETFMIGAKGFRAREATANYKRRERRLVSDEVRAARFANLFGNDVDDADEVEAVVAVETEQDVPSETQAEETAESTKEADAREGADRDASADAAAAEAAAAEKAAGEKAGGEKPAADKPAKPASKKKASKAAT